jgi:hypothetical protein
MISYASARIWFYVVTAFYAFWAIHRVWVDPESRTVLFFVGTSMFLFLFLLPFTIFQAKIEPRPEGLHVLQYRSAVVPYADVKRCIGLFLIPFPTVVVITSWKFPLNVLISGDTFDRTRLQFIQDGKPSKSIKAFM